jgi:hypothetical protein
MVLWDIHMQLQDHLIFHLPGWLLQILARLHRKFCSTKKNKVALESGRIAVKDLNHLKRVFLLLGVLVLLAQPIQFDAIHQL